MMLRLPSLQSVPMDERQVLTRHDLAAFVQTLLAEHQANPTNWENSTLTDFLSAMSRWIEDMDGWYANQGKSVPEEPDWQTFAHILGAATLYE
ncbi:hypothetical protein GCM10010842_27100 [Deinococcus daejeonensis]|uniref:DUF7660 domain-containing protein n=2 Tax=Deinococcus daejeonensis TaxID=1007098 RepID=A0ABQ2J6X5_9DEIO|nr:hypothetical protein GCM10010842_27100 [Deinococcus daejeonensis]